MRKTITALVIVLVLLAITPGSTVSATTIPTYSDVWVDDDAPADWYDGNHVHTIREAIAAVSPAGTIHVLPGTYESQFYIWVNKPLKIIGEGMPVVKNAINILDTHDVTISGLNMTHETVPDFFVIRNSTNVTIENSVLGPSGAGVGIYIYDSRDVTLRNNTFQNLSRQAVVVDKTVENLLIENCRFTKTAKDVPYTAAVHFPDTARVTNAVIRDNVFTDNYQYDILANYNSRVVLVVENNTFTRESPGPGAVKTHTREKVIVRGNFVSNYKTGIYVDKSYGTVIEDNVVKNSVSGIFVWELENGTVRDNIASGNTNGIYMREIAFSTAYGNDLSGNIVGIYLHYARNTNVTHNILRNNNGGVYLQRSENIGLHHNAILSGAQDGILVYTTNYVNITRNYITGYPIGIFVWDSVNVWANYNSIAGNGIGVRTSFYRISPAWVNATLNWWGAEDGPSPLPRIHYGDETPTGSGDPVGYYVHFDPWIGKAPSVVYSTLRVSNTQVSPGENITISATVQVSGPVPTNYTAELKVDGDIKDQISGVVFPGEPQTISFTTSFEREGTYYVTVDGLPAIKVVVKGASISRGTDAYTLLYTISRVWTNFFFLQEDRFKETYQRAQEAGVDQETLNLAMGIYENATKLIAHAWKTDNLEELRSRFWTISNVFPLFYETRKAFLEIKRAVEILEGAMK